MLTFNALLRLHGFDPNDVRLVRHSDNRARTDGTSVQSQVIASWRTNFEAFEIYTRLQGRAIYGDKKLGAIFVAMPDGSTLFAGIWKILSVNRNTNQIRCSITESADADLYIYEVQKLDTMADFERRLSIEWGKATRAWFQHAANQDKKVVAIADEPDPIFPGWASFVTPIKDVPALPGRWQAILANARGVYLLVHRKTGQQYVGCALSDGGFLSRWNQYAESGHGGNVQLKGTAPEDLDVSVLEAVASTANDIDVLQAEIAWKRKLGTRVHGLNSN